jgi:hypothetical protein
MPCGTSWLNLESDLDCSAHKQNVRGHEGGFCPGIFCEGGIADFGFEPMLGQIGLEPTFDLDSEDQLCRGRSAPATEYAVGDTHFSPEDTPPSLPEDSCFQLLPSTLFVSKAPAPQLANSILGFLRDHLHASFVKVRCAKFTVKADLVHDGSKCTVKLRVYRSDNDTLVVEMQRRRGDVVAFVQIFRSLTQYLEKQYTLLEGTVAGPLAGLLAKSVATLTEPSDTWMPVGLPVPSC